MTNVGHYLKSYLILSRKDLGILAALFLIAFVSSFVFLWNHDVYVQRLHVTMQVLGVIIFILLGLNVSFFVFRLLSKPDQMLPLLLDLQHSGTLRKVISELIMLNLLALSNFAFLTFSYVLQSQTIQIVAVSASVATWPLFFLILMNMDGSFYSNREHCNQTTTHCFGGTPVAENCGPAVILKSPSTTYAGHERTGGSYPQDNSCKATAC